MRLSRTDLRRIRPLHIHAFAGDHQSGRLRARLSGRGAAPLRLGLAGDPALADRALIPDLHWNQDPDWAGDGRTIHVNCDYRLVVDNLMDLTHETFVHGSSIGQHAVAEAPFEVTHGDRTATVARWMRNIDPPPFWAGRLGKPGKVDRWQIIRFEAPCTIAIDVGVAPAGTGAPEGDRSQGVNGYVLNSSNTWCCPAQRYGVARIDT